MLRTDINNNNNYYSHVADIKSDFNLNPKDNLECSEEIEESYNNNNISSDESDLSLKTYQNIQNGLDDECDENQEPPKEVDMVERAKQMLAAPKPQNFNAGKFVKRGLVPCTRGCGLFFKVRRASSNKDENNVFESICGYRHTIINDPRYGEVIDDDEYSDYIIHSQHCDIKYKVLNFRAYVRQPEIKTKMRKDVKGCRKNLAGETLLEHREKLVNKTNFQRLLTATNCNESRQNDGALKAVEYTTVNNDDSLGSDESEKLKIKKKKTTTAEQARDLLSQLVRDDTGAPETRVLEWLNDDEESLKKRWFTNMQI